MGRAPCCDKANVKKGPWSPEEDAKLKSYIEQHGTGGNWIALPQKIGLKRCGKSCRLRWLNYLRPNIKHGGFSEEEDNIICSLYVNIGSRWSVIAAQLPGRTDNDIKNYWNTRLKKKLLGKHRKEQAAARNNKGVNKHERMISSSGEYSYFSSSSLVPEENNSSTQQQQPLYWPSSLLEMPVPPHQVLPLPAPTLMPYTNQLGPSLFNDQDSIRKLLIKLGGRFSHGYDHHHHYNQPSTILDDGGGLNHLHQFPINGGALIPSSTHDEEEQVQVRVVGGSSSSGCMNNSSINNNNNQVQLISQSHQYCGEGVAGHELVQGHGSNFTAALGERLGGGLEFFYGEDLITDHHKNIMGGASASASASANAAICGQISTNWGETSTLIYPPLAASSSCSYQGSVRDESPLPLPLPPQDQCVFQQLSHLGAQ